MEHIVSDSEALNENRGDNDSSQSARNILGAQRHSASLSYVMQLSNEVKHACKHAGSHAQWKNSVLKSLSRAGPCRSIQWSTYTEAQ